MRINYGEDFIYNPGQRSHQEDNKSLADEVMFSFYSETYSSSIELTSFHAPQGPKN